jgi:hypothetical protein
VGSSTDNDVVPGFGGGEVPAFGNGGGGFGGGSGSTIVVLAGVGSRLTLGRPSGTSGTWRRGWWAWLVVECPN